MPHRLAETWQWPVLTRECPGCGAAIAEHRLDDHATRHILNGDVELKVDYT